MRKCVYTAIYGGKNDLRIPVIEPGWDYLLYTDDPGLVRPPWILREQDFDAPTPYLAAKRPKVLAHEVLPEYDISLWIDGSTTVATRELDELVSTHLAGYSLALHPHRGRMSLCEEILAMLTADREHPTIMGAVKKLVWDVMHYPDLLAFCCNGVLLRRHNDPQIKALATRWWEWCTELSSFDQDSFLPLVWQLGVPYQVFPAAWTQHRVFHCASHKICSSGQWRTWGKVHDKQLELAQYILSDKTDDDAMNAIIHRLAGKARP